MDSSRPHPRRPQRQPAPHSPVYGPPPPASDWPIIRLLPDRDRLSRSFHPWVFSGAILDTQAALASSNPQLLPAVAKVCAADGRFIAWGLHNPSSKICLRLFNWNEAELPDQAWLARALHAALDRRKGMHDQDGNTTAIRLVFSESDNLPGLIIERLDRWLLLQSENAAMDQWLPLIAKILPEIAQAVIPKLTGILERSDGDGRRMENLPDRRQLLWGSLPEGPVEIREFGVGLEADLSGQKTGFYADQRENRALVARYAKDRRILDVCSYSGAFSCHAQRAGATSLTLVDASADALNLARRNFKDNSTAEFIQGDVFQVLRNLREARRSWDLIILDPPKLAPNRASLERALAAYKDLNLQAIQLLEKDGLLVTFSCSGLVSADDLRQAVAFAAKDCGRQLQILHYLHQAPCHPVLLSFPEAYYLKGFILRVL